MKVKMNIHISGSRNGVRWPEAGAVVDLPEGEAADLCAAGYAEPVAEERVEKRPAKKAEKRG